MFFSLDHEFVSCYCKDKTEFATLLRECGNSRALARGKRVHSLLTSAGYGDDAILCNLVVQMYGKCGNLDDARSRIIRSGIYKDDVVLATALVSMLGKFGEMEQARTVFSGMAKRTAISWNAMLAAYCDNGHARKALELYHAMDVDPDEVTYMTVAEACSSSRDLQEAGALHERAAASGMLAHVPLANALVAMYGKCGSLADARAVFKRMPRRDATSWTSMIVACARGGDGVAGVAAFYAMGLEGVAPDEISFLAVLFCCSHTGLGRQGREFFVLMLEELGARAEHYVCMVDLVGRLGWVEEAQRLLEAMPFQAGSIAWLALLGSCNVQRSSRRGALAAERVIELELEEARRGSDLQGL
ncbi:hypothetical protein SELMODRAFT_96515 [Selaginella moellendorffii]|uniref:Pentacotripeptide-repeat region of PRORP domain-containing protein n=1 Tax=Selaginella moellendorffii TaxID=88036 RepID=D8RLB6_SELML|nr:hypothetical protein SELMODRAFT_96515 [Selaginella moellendorffii]